MKKELTIICCCIMMLSLQTANAQNWKVTGNGGTNPATQFIGTTDNVSLNLRTNNATRMTIGNTGNVGIGTTSPTAKLEVIGKVKITDGTQGIGKVLTSDANGLASWQTPASVPSDAWSRIGNAGTVDGTNFLGTTDNVPLNFRVNNLKAGRIDPALSNTFFGYQSGNANTTGDHNTAIGRNTLYSNSTGYGNTATGVQALYSNTTGIHNSACGHEALYFNTTGILNSAFGYQALRSNTTGIYNTAFGSFTLTGTTSSSNNVAVGSGAGHTFDNGYNNVFLGSNADANGADYYNVIAIGQGTIVPGVSTARFGNAATGSYGGWADWTNVSDGRYKKNVKENVPGLAFIDKLRPVTYTLDASGLDAFMHKNVKDELSAEAKAVHKKALQEKEKITYTGFIAQEVEASAKELDFDFSGVDAARNKNDVYGLRYAEFVVPLVKAVQELDKTNEELKMQNAELKSRIEKLESILSGKISTTQQLNNSTTSLEQNSPNPFNTQTEIKFRLPSTFSSAQLIITDANGRQVRNDVLKSSSSVIIKAAELSAGTYSYSLIIDGVNVDTRQMVLTK